jgi:hypothetical protein
MTRLYLKLGLTLLLLLSVLAFVGVGLAQIIKADELVFARCYDSSREHCGLRFLDLNKGIITSLPVEGTPFTLEWSPDGTRLAISQLTVDGTVFSVLGTDGSSIAFRRMGFLSAWLSEDRLMMQGEAGDFQVYDFSQEVFEPYALHAMDEYNSYYFVQLSPDRRYVAMSPMSSGVNALFIEPIDTSLAELELAGDIFDQNFDWSPDSQMVVYSLPRNGYNIFTTDISSGETLQITSNNVAHLSPRWSHRGERLAYISRSDFYQYYLSILESDGSFHQIDLTAGISAQIISVMTLEWSPDDRAVLLTLAFMDNIGELYLVSTDGTDTIRRLTYDGDNFLPTWRP